MMNASAVVSNQGRMPVLYDYPFCDSTHFTYTEPLSIRNWLTTDILSIGGMDNILGIFSFGDVFLVIGVLGNGSLAIWFVIRKHKEKNENKNKKN